MFHTDVVRNELDHCSNCFDRSKYYIFVEVLSVQFILLYLYTILKICVDKNLLLSIMSTHCSDNRTSISEFFELPFAESSFKSSLLDDNDIDLGYYLTAYEELYKFCQLLGTVFSFVGSEIKSKMEILVSLKKADENNYFKTMKSMVEYEMKNNLLSDKNYISGSRTLLRLHRGLDFLRQFLERVGNLENHESTNNVGQEVYAATLAKYHSWLVRKGASMAMYVLPTREVLLQKV
ncbi:hypothetical protein LSTR_LSTR017255, partial [Laodelphax striatellus]